MDLTKSIRNYLTSQIERTLNHLIASHHLDSLGIGGDVVLEDVRLQPGILRHLLGAEAGADLDLARGTARELRISIPWARILAQAQPVLQVTLRTVEVHVVRRKGEEAEGGDDDARVVDSLGGVQEPRPIEVEAGKAELPLSGGSTGSGAGAGVAPPGWLQSLGKKLAMNVTLKVENLTVQFEEEGAGVVASAYICNVLLQSADPRGQQPPAQIEEWTPAYNECDPLNGSPWLFKLLRLDDVTLCLDERTPASTSRRRHEAPLMDRASFRMCMALDVRDVFGFHGTAIAGAPDPAAQHPKLMPTPPSPLQQQQQRALPGAPSSSAPSSSPPAPSMRSRLAGLFAPMSMDGIFLDSPYALPAFSRGDQEEEEEEEEGGAQGVGAPEEKEEAMQQGLLPPAFGILCPLLRSSSSPQAPATAATRWRYPRQGLGPWEDEEEMGKEWRPFDRRAHAAAVVDVDCQRLKLSLSNRQVLLLRELLRACQQEPPAGAKQLKGEGAVLAGEMAAGDSAADQRGGAPAWRRLQVASCRIRTVTLSLVQHAPDALALSSSGATTAGLLFPSRPVAAPGIVLRLVARELTVDHQAVMTMGSGGEQQQGEERASDLRVALAALDVAYAGEPEEEEEGQGAEERADAATAAALLAPSAPMRLLLQWGHHPETASHALSHSPTTAAPVLLEALHARTLRAKGMKTKESVADVVVDAAGLRPAPGSAFALRRRVERSAAGAAVVLLDGVLGEEEGLPLHVHCTPAALVGLAAFLPHSSTPAAAAAAAAEGQLAPRAGGRSQHQYRCRFRTHDISLGFTALPGRPPCTVRVQGLVWEEGEQRERSLELTRLCASAGPQLPLLETGTLCLVLSASASSSRLSIPEGVQLSVLPAHWRLLAGALRFALRSLTTDGSSVEAAQALLTVHVGCLPLRRPPLTCVRMGCAAVEVVTRACLARGMGGSAEGGGGGGGDDALLSLNVDGLEIAEWTGASAASPILRTERVEVGVAIGAELRTVEVRAPQLLETWLSPLKVLGLKRAVLTLGKVAAEVAAGLSKDGCSGSGGTSGSSTTLKEEKLRVVADRFDVHLALPWLEEELPSVFFACQQGEYSSHSRGDQPFIHHAFTVARVRAEGQGRPLPTTARRRTAAARALGLVQDRVAPFLSPDDRGHLASVLATTAEAAGDSPVAAPAAASTTVPVPILHPISEDREEGEEPHEPFFQMAWRARRATRATVHMEIDFGRCACLLYFPLLFSLIRLGTLAASSSPSRGGPASKRRRARTRTRTGDSSASGADTVEEELEPSTLLLRAAPSRALLLAGNLPEARFALEFRLGPFCMWRRSDGPRGEAPTELRRLSFTSSLGQWRQEAQQGLELQRQWPLTDRVDFEVSCVEEGGEEARVVQVSPIVLRVGTLELAVLYRCLGVFGRSVTRAAPLAEELERGAGGDGVEPEEASEEPPNLRVACPYLVLSLKTPRPRPVQGDARAALDDPAVAFQLTLEDVALHVGHWAGALRVKEALLRDCRPQAQLAFSPQPSATDAALAVSWCKWAGGRHADVCIALPRPTTVRLDPAAAALLGRLVNFLNVDLAGVGAAGGLSSPRSRRARRRGKAALLAATRLWRRTETIRVLGEHLTVVLVPPAPPFSAEGTEGLQLTTAALAFSYRTTGSAFEQRLHLGQLAASVLSSQAAMWPLMDPANATLTVEEARPSQAAARTHCLAAIVHDDGGEHEAMGMPVGPPRLSLHLEPLRLHAYPRALVALRPVVAAFTTKPAAAAAAVAAGAAASTRGMHVERCPLQLVPLSRLEMMVLEEERGPFPLPSQCEPGTLLTQATPALRSLPTAVPRATFVHVQGTAAAAGASISSGYVALTWAFPVPVRAAAVRVPDVLVLRTEGPLPPQPAAAAGAAFPLVLELATTAAEGGEEGDVMAAVARFEVSVRMGGDEGQVECQPPPRSFPCDTELAERAWQLSLLWDTAALELPPLEWLWRPLALALADEVGLEVVAPESDRLRAVLQLAVPHALVRLYPQSSDEGGEEEEEEKEELALLTLKDVQGACRVRQGQGPMEMTLRAEAVEGDVLDAARWTLLPALRGEGLALRYGAGTAECHVSSLSRLRVAELREVGPPSLALSVARCRVNLSARILYSLDALRRDWQTLPAATATEKEAPTQQRPRSVSRRYRIVNRTRHSLWLSQQLTNETVRVPPHAEKGYSWRAPAAGHSAPRLLLRFALHIRQEVEGPSVWSEPVEADVDGARCVALRTSDEGVAEDVALLLRRAGSQALGTAGRRVRLWLVVERRRLETRLVLRGGCEVRSFLPMPLDLRLAPPKQHQEHGLEVKQALEYVRLEAAASPLCSPSCDSLLLDEAFMDAVPAQQQHPPLMVVQARVASASASAASEFGHAMMLALPERVGLQEPCSIGSGGADPGERAYHPRWSTTALGQAPAPQPAYFLCHLRRVPVRLQAGNGDAGAVSPSSSVWGWLSLEVWPLAYLANAAAPAQFRLLAWDRPDAMLPALPIAAAEPLLGIRGSTMAPLTPVSPARGNDAMSSSMSGSGAGGPGGREVDARRMLEEKIQRLSFKRLQEGTVGASGQEGESGLETPMATSLGGRTSEDGHRAAWHSLPAGGAPMALTTADPRHGMALSLRLAPEPSPAFFSSLSSSLSPQRLHKANFLVPSHRLLAWVRGGGGVGIGSDADALLLDARPAPLTDTAALIERSGASSVLKGEESLLRGFVPVAMRQPTRLGPSLLLRLVPVLTVANHCPFPVSLVALTPRHPGLLGDSSINTTIQEGKDAATAASEFGGFIEAGIQVLSAGQETAAEAWAWPAGSPIPVLAVGVTAAQERDASVLKLREARREEPWRQQGWSKPLALATLLEALRDNSDGAASSTGVWAEMSVLVPVQGELLLPLVLRLAPRPLATTEGPPSSNADGGGLPLYRLEVRPRFVLHSAVATPEGARVAVRYAASLACPAAGGEGLDGQERGHSLHHPLLPTTTAAAADGTAFASGVASQVVLVRRARRGRSTSLVEDGWMSPEKGSPVRRQHPTGPEQQGSVSSPGVGAGGEQQPQGQQDVPGTEGSGVVVASPMQGLPESPGGTRGRAVSAAFKRIWCRAVRHPPPLDDEAEEEEAGARAGRQMHMGGGGSAAVFEQALELCLVPVASAAAGPLLPPPSQFFADLQQPGQPPCSPLVVETVDEDLREVHFSCARPGLGLWGLNGKDVVALKAKAQYHQGTHHLLLAVEPATPLVLLNRSCLIDVCVGLEKQQPHRSHTHSTAAPSANRRSSGLSLLGGAREEVEQQADAHAPVAIPAQHTVRIATGARVEWDPLRGPLLLKSVARDTRSTAAGELAPSRESSMDDSGLSASGSAAARVATTQAAAGPEGSAAAASAVRGEAAVPGGVLYRRSTFPTKQAPVLTYRLRGCVAGSTHAPATMAAAASAWSARLHTGESSSSSSGGGIESDGPEEEPQVVELKFPSAAATDAKGTERSRDREGGEEEEEGMENHAQELQGALCRTGKVALVVKAVAVAGMCCLVIEDADAGTRSRSGSVMQQRRRQQQPSSMEVCVKATTLEIQLLEDDAASRSFPVGKHEPQDQGTMRLPAALYTRVSGLECRYSAGPLGARGPLRGYRTLEASLQDLQTDHLAADAEFPVVLACLQPPQGKEGPRPPALAFRFCEVALDPGVVGVARPRSYIEALSLFAGARLRVGVDGALLHTATSFLQGRMLGGGGADTGGEGGDAGAADAAPALPPAIRAQLLLLSPPCLFLRSVRLHPLSVLLDARLYVPGSDVFLGLDASPLAFEEVALNQVATTPHGFVKGLAANYLADAILRSPALLGSLQILGSPAVLLSRVLSGLKDLVRLSATGSLSGAGKGLLSLTRHVVGGTLSSVAAISSSVRRNLDTHGGGGRESRRSSTIGVVVGAEPLPLQQLQQQPPSHLLQQQPGQAGLLAGVGKGLLKAVALPISGAMGVVQWTSERLISSTGVNRGMEEGKEPLDYGPLGTGAACSVHTEALYRHACRLPFAKGTWVAEVRDVYLEQPRRPRSSSLTLSGGVGGSRSGPLSISGGGGGGWFSSLLGGGSAAGPATVTTTTTPQSTDGGVGGLSWSSSRSGQQPLILPVTLVLAGDAIYVLSGHHGSEALLHTAPLAARDEGRWRWRHVRVEASPSSLGSAEGVTVPTKLARYEPPMASSYAWNLIEVCEEQQQQQQFEGGAREAMAPHALRLWMADEPARAVAAFVGGRLGPGMDSGH